MNSCHWWCCQMHPLAHRDPTMARRGAVGLGAQACPWGTSAGAACASLHSGDYRAAAAASPSTGDPGSSRGATGMTVAAKGATAPCGSSSGLSQACWNHERIQTSQSLGDSCHRTPRKETEVIHVRSGGNPPKKSTGISNLPGKWCSSASAAGAPSAVCAALDKPASEDGLQQHLRQLWSWCPQMATQETGSMGTLQVLPQMESLL